MLEAAAALVIALWGWSLGTVMEKDKHREECKITVSSTVEQTQDQTQTVCSLDK